MNVLTQLENAKSEEERNALMQILISKGITMEIPNFEVKKMEYLGKTLDGFSISSSLRFQSKCQSFTPSNQPLCCDGCHQYKNKDRTFRGSLYTYCARTKNDDAGNDHSAKSRQ